MKLKGTGAYEIKPPIMDWDAKDIAIEIHCDAGRILTQSGSRAPVGIRVLFSKTDF